MDTFDFEISLPWTKDCVAEVVGETLNNSPNAELEKTLNPKNLSEKKSPRGKTTFKEVSEKSSTIRKELLLELKDQESEIVDLVVKILKNPEIELNIQEIDLLKKMYLGRNGFANAFNKIVSLNLGRGNKIPKPDFYDYVNTFLKTLRKSIALYRFSTLNLSGELQGKEKEVQDLWIKMFEDTKIKLDENQLNLLKSMHKQKELFRELYDEMNSFGAIDRNYIYLDPYLHSEGYQQYFLTILINNITEETPQGHTIYSLGPKGLDGREDLQVIVCNPITSTYLIIDGFLIDGKEEVYTQDIPRYPDIERRPPDPFFPTIMG